MKHSLTTTYLEGGEGGSRGTLWRDSGGRGGEGRGKYFFFDIAFLLQFGDLTEFVYPNQRRTKVDSDPPVLVRVWIGKRKVGQAHLVNGAAPVAAHRFRHTQRVSQHAGYPNHGPALSVPGRSIPTGSVLNPSPRRAWKVVTLVVA